MITLSVWINITLHWNSFSFSFNLIFKYLIIILIFYFIFWGGGDISLCANNLIQPSRVLIIVKNEIIWKFLGLSMYMN